MSAPMKVCRKCQAEFAGERCKRCDAKRSRESYRARKAAGCEKDKLRTAAYREKFKEQLRIKKIAWETANLEKVKAQKERYYKENSERIIAKSKAWAKDNPEKMKASYAARRLKNPGYAKERSATYRALNAEKFQEANLMREAVGRRVLSDSYVRRLLCLSAAQAPKELIELKRVQLQITRKLKELKK